MPAMGSQPLFSLFGCLSLSLNPASELLTCELSGYLLVNERNPYGCQQGIPLRMFYKRC